MIGVNNFAILYIFGYQFAPKYKNIKKKSNSLYGFKKLSEYKNGLLKPVRKINTSLIKEKWQNIQEANIIKGLSPVAWQHVNFYGRYIFQENLGSIDMDEIVSELNSIKVEEIIREHRH